MNEKYLWECESSLPRPDSCTGNGYKSLNYFSSVTGEFGLSLNEAACSKYMKYVEYPFYIS